MSNLNNILSHSACLSQQQLLQYLNNTLEQEEMRIVEEHFSDCMFCSDAFDGLSTLSQVEITSLLADIKSNTETKVDEHLTALQEEEAQKLIATQGGKSRKSWVAAAGILLLMFGGGAALFSYFNDHHQQEIQLAKNDKTQQPISKEKATIKEGSKELSTLSLDQPDLAEMEAEEIVAINDSKKYKRSSQPPVVEKAAEKENKAMPAQAPRFLETRRDVTAPIAKNTTVGSSVGKELDRTEKAVQKKRKQEVVAKLDEQAAKDFSSMNTATMPKYQGKLKTTPQQSNFYIDKKAGEKEDNTRSLAEITQEGQSAYGKKQTTLTSYQQGYALYIQAEYKKSIRYFKKALRKKDVDNAAEIKYYLALALQKVGKEKEADDLLAELEKGTQFKESARRARRSNSR